MSSSFSASQFNSSYSPKALGNWEVPATGRDRSPKANHPAARGPTQFVVNDNGCALRFTPPHSRTRRTPVPSTCHSQAPARHGQEQENDGFHDGLRGPRTSRALARQASPQRRHVYATAAASNPADLLASTATSSPYFVNRPIRTHGWQTVAPPRWATRASRPAVRARPVALTRVRACAAPRRFAPYPPVHGRPTTDRPRPPTGTPRPTVTHTHTRPAADARYRSAEQHRVLADQAREPGAQVLVKGSLPSTLPSTRPVPVRRETIVYCVRNCVAPRTKPKRESKALL